MVTEMSDYIAPWLIVADEQLSGEMQNPPCCRPADTAQTGEYKDEGIVLPVGFESTDYQEEHGTASYIDPDDGLVLLIGNAGVKRHSPRFTLYRISLLSEPLPGNTLIQSDDYAAVLRCIDQHRHSPQGTASPVTPMA